MFIHLRLHTEFSVIDGTVRVDEAIAAAVADAQPALAITDLGNLFGAVKFYKAARKAGVKPILGAEIWVAGPGKEDLSRLLLLAQNRQGYLHLAELLTQAWTASASRTQAAVDIHALRRWNAGLIALSGAQHGPLGVALLAGDEPRAEHIAAEYAALFAGRFYIEIQRADRPDDAAHVAAAVALAHRMRLPVVATHPIQFITAADFEAHEARVCIAEGETLADPRRQRRFTREQYCKTSAQMQALFADLPAALANTVEIARRCNLSLDLGSPRLPHFPIPPIDGKVLDAEAYFRHVAHEGLRTRMEHLYPNPQEREKHWPRYRDRLEFELDTIVKMGFPGYFLIVGDFIHWAKTHGCPVGPGRGSGAGSLVAYSLLITDLDPLQYQLLFERFLNPERVSMPDFDIDFCQANRDRVIEYVKQKYGKEAVSQIATFGTMAARAAVRDVGRVLGLSYTFCDGISKLIPNKPGVAVTLQKPPAKRDPDDKLVYAVEAEPLLAQREEKEEDVRTVLELARKLEGLTRNVGMHAGGVLIAPGKLTDFCPLYQQPGSDAAISQFDKGDVESVGLVKFDFLGLATLTILELAKDMIIARHPTQRDFRLEDLPLHDPAVYRLFQQGATEAVFQFESRGMQGMLRDARPTCLEDLIALNALYRPGPMDLIPSFVARKHGRETVEYPHPLLQGILAETYGIMVYQEQVMQTAQVLGGYSLGAADMLRRAMGKKDADEMARHRQIFRDGAAQNGIDQAKADEVFDLMEKFAGYGFNKSHAAAYSLLAYQTAWIKVHFSAEFFCANMTVEMDDTDTLHALYQDATRMGLRFVAPDINRGTQRFEPLDDHTICYSLCAVKGSGGQAIAAIVAAREGQGVGPVAGDAGPFRSLFDFCARVDRSRVNKRTVEALVKAGAFDTLHGNHAGERSRILASVDLAFEYAAAVAAHAKQAGLFDGDGGNDHGSVQREPELEQAAPWGVRERLGQEKQAIGFCLTGHLFEEVADEVRRFLPRTLAQLVDSREPQWLAGIVSGLRIVHGQRGRLGLFRLDDGTAAIEARADDQVLGQHRDALQDDALVFVEGKVQPDRFGGGWQINVQRVWGIEEARQHFAKHLLVRVQLSPGWGNAELAALLREHGMAPTTNGASPQGLPVRLCVQCPSAQGTAVAEVQLAQTVRPSSAALAQWCALVGEGAVEVVYESSAVTVS
ncbi:DNA polymerase III subunit alpha [Candidatus Symbiobacter mobilis]|uniref:DNA polymerase III subunit alpha n=1 Tax=Candidatus Symbiobacter mobilis CR TaxID=946483 RepID=U5NAX3_9BURK|nr:DNA polymerase III subunit alpha [Candidatus Symbiobacter mobilis]AGX88567.1 DNA polymerase III subunit alpha [Candidatus Symbiobacter mobilis CR]